MIKIISTVLRASTGLLTGRAMYFSRATSEVTTGKKEKTDKVAKKTQNINAMFTDKAIEESKERKITNGKMIIMKVGLGRRLNSDLSRLKIFISSGTFA